MTNVTGQPESERGASDDEVALQAAPATPAITSHAPPGLPVVQPPNPRMLPTLADVGKPAVEEAFGGSGVAPDAPMTQADKDAMSELIVAALKEVYDPEIPVNIYDLGLIYGVEIDDHANVEISMTLTAPGCPVAGYMVEQVATQAGKVEGVQKSHVTLTWSPPWTKYRMTEAAMLELGLL